MKSVFKPVRSAFPPESIERILSRYYQQLVEWSLILARGDSIAAEEAVQDLCLHLTVVQPDLSGVNNLDNYLFMCLRNMYVSNLARASRERLRVIQVEDYDAVGAVAAKVGLDTVDVQNELLRICDYVMSRKYVSKSASHFILHFFLGYRRSDVALLARLPIAAIYNKLKEIREELREHLSAEEKIRLVPRGAARERKLLRAAIATDLFLRELRTIILDADPASCVTETELVAAYKQSVTSPVECRELAHLAGCEHCLKVLERALQLDDHDGPFDGIDAETLPKKEEKKSFQAAMRMVRRRREQVLERRPTVLAIAVDGNVVAFHAVDGAHNSLSSRVGSVATVRFVEVFDEYGDRMAHIPLDSEFTTVPGELLSQQTQLSDNRRLSLKVRFDGIGLHADVDYVDPALAPSRDVEESQRAFKVQERRWQRFWNSGRFRLTPWTRVAFASLLLAVASGIAGYRYIHPGWQDILSRANTTAMVPLPAETLHQVLRIEQAMGPEKGSLLGFVDVWSSSDRHVVRRLYNARQKLLATSMDAANGTSTVHLEEGAADLQVDRQLIESGVWRSDVSSAAFVAHQNAQTEAMRSSNGFEITQNEDGRNGILARTLVLDRNYHVQAEKVRYRTKDGVFEVRLVQTLLRSVPNRDVPSGTFSQPQGITVPGAKGASDLPFGATGNPAQNTGSANLEVSILYVLFQENMDIGQPIEVNSLPNGRVRMTGTLANAQALAKIREMVAMLPNAEQVDFQIYTTAEAASVVRRSKALRQELVGTDSDAPATALVRDALLARGLKGTALQGAEQEFASSALSHAQTALQHAYALDRLGAILRSSDSSSLNPEAQLKWAQMVERHSAIALTEFDVLRLQLNSISPDNGGPPSSNVRAITNPGAFAQAASELRVKAQTINEKVVELFAGSPVGLPAAQVRDSLAHLQAALPVSEASHMRSFASRLTNHTSSEQTEVGENHQR